MRLHRVPHARLVPVGDALFGETDYAQNLRAHVKALGIEERAHFTGFQHDAASWMNVMDERQGRGRACVNATRTVRPCDH